MYFARIRRKRHIYPHFIRIADAHQLYIMIEELLFPRWYQSERILAENHILVYPRPGYPVSSDSLSENVKVASSPTFEISSTFIRRAMEEGKDVRYFLHPAVYEALQTAYSR